MKSFYFVFFVLCVAGLTLADELDFVKPTFDEDYNFDGHPDKKVFDSKGGGRYTVNEQFNISLFNPKTKTYELNQSLSALSNPYTDPKTKQVHASARQGTLGGEYQIYVWKGSELVLIERTIVKENNETQQIHTTVEKIIDGKMTKVSEDIETIEEYNQAEGDREPEPVSNKIEPAPREVQNPDLLLKDQN